MNPKISVIIACYKQAQYIKKAINSVLSQTYKNYEIIVISDCSPDNVDEEVKEFIALPNFTYVKFNTNRGLGVVRNFGATIATGEWILPLDSDDTIQPSYIQKCVDKIIDYKTIVYSDNRDTDVKTENELFGLCKIIPFSTLEDLICNNCMPVTALFSKQSFEEVGGYIEDREWMQITDWDLWCNLIRNGGRPIMIPEQLFYRYIHGENMTFADNSGNYWPKFYQYIRNKYSLIIRKKVNNLYLELLGRPADEDGLFHYARGNYSIHQIKDILLNSEEYKRR